MASVSGGPASARFFLPAPREGDEARLESVEALTEELPLPSELCDGQILVVEAGAAQPSGLFGRFRRRPSVHRAVRGAALLARGYVDVAGGSFEGRIDAVWGRAVHRLTRSVV